MKSTPTFTRRATAQFAWLTLAATLLLPARLLAAPSVSNVPNTSTDDESALNHFASVNVNNNGTNVQQVFFDFSPTNLGSFNLPVTNGGRYLFAVANAVAAENLLQALVFTPVANVIPVGSFSNVIVRLHVVDSGGSSSGTNSSTLKITALNNSPSFAFAGVGTKTINDNDSTNAFTGFTINDVDNSATQPVTVTVLLDNSAKGSFTNLGSFTDLTNSFVFTGTAAAATTAIRALTFVPVPNRAAVGTNETTVLKVVVDDDVATPLTNNLFSVVSVSVNDVPVFTGITTNHVPVRTGEVGQPFSVISLVDLDVATNFPAGERLSWSVAFTNTGSGSLEIGGSSIGSVYRSTNDASTASSILRGLTYRAPTLPIADTNLLTFILTASDGHPNSSVTNLVLVDLYSQLTPPGLSGMESGQVVNDNTTLAAFSRVSIQSGNGTAITVRVQLSGVTNDNQGQLINLGDFTRLTSLTAASIYEFTGTSEAATTGIRALFFQPTPNRIAGTTSELVTFGITVIDGAQTNGPDTSTSVSVIPVNDTPQVVGIPAQNTIRDNETFPPFTTLLIADADEGGQQIVTATIALDVAAKGAFTPASLAASGFSISGNNYLFTSNAAALTAAIRQLVYLPTPNRVPVGQNEIVTFNLNLNDAHGGNVNNSGTTLRVIAVSGGPFITVPTPQPVSIPAATNNYLFANVSIADPATNVTVNLRLNTPAQGSFTTNSLALAGFTNRGGGEYYFSGTATNATTGLRLLNFTPAPALPDGASVAFSISATNSLFNYVTVSHTVILRATKQSYLVTKLTDYDPANPLVPPVEKTGTLRDAITRARNNDHVTFDIRPAVIGQAAYPATIRLVAPITLDYNLTFDGPGADQLTINGDSDTNGVGDIQLFTVNATVTMNRLAFTKGYASFGGGAFEVNTDGDLTLNYCAVTDCTADVWGGGVDVNLGSLRMEHCLVASNRTSSALGQGGGGVSVYTIWPCLISHTTFATNRQESVAGLGGGALYAESADAGEELQLDLLHCTFRDNRDLAGHGTAIRPNVASTLVRVQNSVVADGQGKNLEMDQSGTIQSLGGNFSDDGTLTIFSSGGLATNTVIFRASGDHVNLAATNLLAPLAANGGPTLTFALLTNSLAVNAGISNSPASIFHPLLGNDQRGFHRDASLDSGAFERGANQRVVIQEIYFNPPVANDEFIEFAVPRDSVAVDFTGFAVLVDGTLRHTFTNGLVNPGEALVVFSKNADTNLVAATAAAVQRQTATNNLLLDNSSGVITLVNAAGQTLFTTEYVGAFACSDTNNDGFLANTNQSVVLSPLFTGVFLPYQRVVAKEGGSRTNNYSDPGYSALHTPLAPGNSPPLAYDDAIATDAHTALTAVTVRANDVDADITDVIRVQSLGAATNTLTAGTNFSVLGAQLIINDAPDTGVSVTYNPLASAFIYALPEGSNVVDTFYYSIRDYSNGVANAQSAAELAAATARVTVAVVGVNAAPTPAADSYATSSVLTTPEDTLLDFTTVANLLGNDTDPNTDDNSNTLAIVAINDVNSYVSNRVAITTALGASAVLDIRFDRNETHITYDPSGSATLNTLGFGQTATDTFYYTVRDRHGATTTAAVAIRVTGVNDAPVASANNFATDEDTAVSVTAASLLANDTDVDVGATLIVTSVSATSARGASVTLVGTNIVYNPAVSATLNALANKEFATDTFTYTATDEFSLSSNAVVTVTVAGVNDHPVSTPDAWTTDEDTQFATNAPGVLANDVEPDINSLTPDDAFRVIPATNVTGGGVTVAFRPDGSFSYDPRGLFDWLKAGSNINETVNYVVMDHSLSLANDDNFAVTATTTNNVLPVLANDSVLSLAGGAFQLVSLTTPTNGGVAVLNASSNAILYTPAAGVVGSETFSYTVSDGLGWTDTARVIVTLTGSRLFAVTDNFTVARGTTNSFTVLANDRLIPDTGASLIVTALGAPSLGGSVALNGSSPGNTIQYAPAATPTPFIETFSYTVTSGDLVSVGTVSVTVVDRTNTLTARNDNFTVIANSGNNTLNVLANDLILPGPNTNLVITAFTSNSVLGTVSLNAARTRLLYKPSALVTNFVEPVITYTVSDNAGGSATASVLVSIVPSGFIAGDDTFVVVKNSTNTLPVMVNDVLLPNLGQTLFISGIGISSNAPNHGGRVTINGPGTGLVYSPATNYVGNEDFTYEIADGSPARALGHVRVIVLDNSPATSNPDTFRVARDSANNVLLVLPNDYIRPQTPGALRLTALQTNGVHALVTLSGTGTNNWVLYSPTTNFIGTDYFTYESIDLLGNRATNLIRVTVGDLAPRDDRFNVLSGSATNLLDVRANDLAFPDTNTVRAIVAVGTPDHGGTATPNVGATQILYTPAANFTGTEQFTYTLQDDSTNRYTATTTVVVSRRGSDRDTNTLTLTVLGVNDLPTFTGNTNRAITDKQTVSPFATLTLTDLDEYGLQPLTVRLTMDHLDNGTLQNLGGFTQTAPGKFALYGLPANLTTALRGMVYVPVSNHILVPTTVTTHFTVTADDSYVTAPITNLTDVAVTAVNDAPIISGTVAGLRVYSRSSVRPFVGATITEFDNDRLQVLRVTVTLDNAIKGNLSSLGGFSDLGGGVYSLGASNGTVTAAIATTALRGLVFTPMAANRVGFGTNETTRFTIRVDDFYAPTVVDSNTTVVAVNPLTARLTASDKVNGAQFGWSVATTRDLAVIGAPHDSTGTNSGSAYLYTRSLDGSNTWTQFKKLTPPDGRASDDFGYSVAISGDLVVIGARFTDAGANDAGSAYIFSRNQGGTTNWGFAKKLLGTNVTASDQFGYTVAVEGDTVVVGAPLADGPGADAGAAFVYAQNQGGSNVWGLVKKLAAPDLAVADHFGQSVSISGTNVVVGSIFADPSALANAGATYVFGKDKNGVAQWGFTGKLLPSDPIAGDNFGNSVSINGDNLVIGSPLADLPGLANAGAAYVFTKNPAVSNGWTQIKKLTSSEGAIEDRFGSAVALNQDKLVVGAPLSDLNGAECGGAYLFAQHTGGSNFWGQVDKLLPAAVGTLDNFGGSVAVSQNTIVIGAANGLDGAIRPGTAFMFRLKFGNAPQVTAALVDQTVTPSTPLAYTIPANSFTDPDVEDTLTLSLNASLSPPAWLNFNATSGAFTGTPNLVGDYPAGVIATDFDGLSATNGFTIHVMAVPNLTSSLALRRQMFGTNEFSVITLNGVANTTYRLQGTPSLAGTPVWTDLATGLSDGSGIINYYDENPPAPMFYRAVAP